MERVLDSVERAAEIEELEEAMVAKSKVEEVAETQEEEARARAKLKESLLAKSAHLSEKIEYMRREDLGRVDDKGFIPMGILSEYGKLLMERLDVAAKIEELEGKVAEAEEEEEEDLWKDEEELLRTQYEESLLEQWVKMVDNDAFEEVDEESLLEQWVKMVDNDAVEEVEEVPIKSDAAATSSAVKFKREPDSTIIQTLEAYKSSAATSSAVKSAKLYLDAAYVKIDIGVVVGKLIFSEDGYTIDCTKRGMGVRIPRNIDQVGDMKSEALFILLVEKYATCMRLEEEKFYNRFPCIIVRARQPDVATLQFLRKMKVELKIPVLALVDSDPFGVYILSVYGRSMPDIKWLGVRPSDLDKHKIPDYVRLPMTEKDIKYVKALLKGDFVKNNPGRVKELNLMMESKYKAECEALSRLGLQYLTRVYLPRKLQEMDWL